MDGNHPLAGIGLRFDITVKNVSKADAQGETVGTDDVVVPGFLQVAEGPVNNVVEDDGEEPKPHTVH